MPRKPNPIEHKTQVCGRCGLTFVTNAIKRCPHPAVNRRYGEHVCMYCCAACKHHTHPVPGWGAIGCGYKEATDGE